MHGCRFNNTGQWWGHCGIYNHIAHWRKMTLGPISISRNLSLLQILWYLKPLWLWFKILIDILASMLQSRRSICSDLATLNVDIVLLKLHEICWKRLISWYRNRTTGVLIYTLSHVVWDLAVIIPRRGLCQWHKMPDKSPYIPENPF